MHSEIIKLFIILVLIILLFKAKLNLGINLLFNSLLMGILFKVELRQIFVIWKKVFINPITFELIGIIFFIYLLNIVLEKLRKFEGIVTSLQSMIKDYRLIMIFISSFVALLPVQGGAIFSAPMIKKIGEKNQISPEKNMFINYWFRHVWNFVWPLFPDIILYSLLLGIPLKTLIVTLLPLSVIVFFTGTIWVYRNLSKTLSYEKEENTKYIKRLRDLIQNIWPVLIIILLVLLFDISLLFALILVIMVLFILHPEIRIQIPSLFFDSIKASYKTLLLCFGVLIFKEMFEYSKVIELLPDYFSSIGIPIQGILIIVPFLIGFFTGSDIAYIAICVPIFLFFLIDTNGIIMSHIVLLYVAGYIGIMSTPMHLCLAITKDYFHIQISQFYHILIIHLFILGIFAVIYSIFLTNIMN